MPEYRLSHHYADGTLVRREEVVTACCLSSLRDYLDSEDEEETPEYNAANPGRYVEVDELVHVGKWTPGCQWICHNPTKKGTC